MNYMMWRIREMRGMTEKELGIKAGFSKSWAERRIVEYEYGKKVPDIQTLKKIAEALDVKASILRDVCPTKDELSIICMLFKLQEHSCIKLCENKNVAHINEKYPFLDRYCDDHAIYIKINSYYVEEILKEWIYQMKRKNNNEITDKEYVDWIAHIPDNFYSSCEDFFLQHL